MSSNQIKVRHKEISKPKTKKINVLIGLAVITFLGATLAFAVAVFPTDLIFLPRLWK